MAEWVDQVSPLLAIAQRTQGRWRVFGLQGELTYATCDELAHAVGVDVDGTKRPYVAVDASDLEFFDSSGIRCLLLAARRVRDKGGEFMVLDAGRLMRRIYWMHLTDTLPVTATLPA